MSKEVRVQIYEFFSTYFSTIRDFIIAIADVAAHIPEIFRFPYIVLTLKCPDGYVVAAYPSRIEDNYIYIEQAKPVGDTLKMLPNKILGTESHAALGVDQLGGSGRIEAILDRVETETGPLPTTGWKFLHIATSDHQWSAAEARKSAEGLIGIFKARAALYEPGSGGGFIQNYDRVVLRREVVDRLHAVLNRYKAVVNEKTFAERVIHRYLRDHPILLYPTKKRLLFEYPLVESGVLRYRIDFIIELTSGRYILVELENPNHQVFTAKGDYSSAVTHAERQVEDWMVHIRMHQEQLEADLPGILSPEGLIIVGRGSSLTNSQRSRIKIRNEQHKIKLLTYDDLSEEAENHILHILEA